MEDYNEWRAIAFGISTKQTLLLCTSGVHLIEIPLWLLKRHVAFNSTDYYFFSLNFASIEIERERVSSSQNERTL